MTSVQDISAGFTVRPTTGVGEAEGILRVANIYDSEPLSVEEYTRQWESWPSSDPRLRLVGEVGGEIVATSSCRRSANMKAGVFFLTVAVDPRFAGQGIGSALVEQSEAFARAEAGTKVTAFVPESPDTGRPFAEKRGYVWSKTLFESVLPVSSLDDVWADRVLERVVSGGIVRFLTLADLGATPENERRLFEVIDECDQDEPGTIEFGGMSWDRFERTVLQTPWYRPEGVILALVGDEWAGVHTIGPMDGSAVADMSTDFTGVRRPFRGRGIALALKVLGVRYTKRLGRTRIMTHNDSTNAPMLAVNRKLGFVPRPGWLFMNKNLEEPTT